MKLTSFCIEKETKNKPKKTTYELGKKYLQRMQPIKA